MNLLFYLKPILICILYNSIFYFVTLSDFKTRNVIFWRLTIITASKMFGKTEDQIVHFTSLQRGFFSICMYLCSIHILIDVNKIEVTRS